ncbi:MAG: oxidoreductase [Clostridia bacterium]|nr:oxidoreductase [Clostridia bacterium]MBC7347407.1 oxidoreductase [Clostridia bacterium]
MSGKPKIAVYKLSSCAGCQLEFLNLEPVLLDVVGALDISYFVMAKRDNAPGPYDIGFVEGAVTCGEEIAKLKAARRDCKTLVALGSCACFGGLPSIKNWEPQREVEARVYSELWAIHSTKAYGIDQYVPVDAYLRGCPIDKGELVELIKNCLLGAAPAWRFPAVCTECKIKENVCLLIYENKPCMGPVTAAGCGALCPTYGKPCEGCRGPAHDANAPSLARIFGDLGLNAADVTRYFRKYAGTTPAFQEGAEAL